RVVAIAELSEVTVVHRDADTAVEPLVAMRDLNRSIARAIIHDEQFEIRERLAEDALDRRREERLAVVGREQHADGGRAHRDLALSVARTRRTKGLGIHGWSSRLP